MRLFDILIWITCLFSIPVQAVERKFQDLKLPSQQMVERQTVAAPILANTTYVISGSGGVTATSPVTVTTFAHQPDVPRNLTVTPSATTADVTACTIVISGKDYYGTAISENFAIVDTQSTTTTGALAFKTVTSVAFPANCEGGATHAASWGVGVGSKLGFNHCLAGADHFFHAGLAGVKEATAPTLATDPAIVSRNTASLSGTLNGAKDVTLFYAQNFRCHP